MHIPGADLPQKQSFRNALSVGREEECREIMRRHLTEDQCSSLVAEEFLTDAMHAMGDAWKCSELDPYQERRACEICMRLIRELVDRLPNSHNDAPIAIGGTPSGDPYQLPTAMVELTLREHGWNASSLGNNLPMDCFLQAVHDCRPQLVWLSVSTIADLEFYVAEHNRFADALSDDVILLVGGRALSDSVRPKLQYTAHCDSLSHLTELASAINTRIRHGS